MKSLTRFLIVKIKNMMYRRSNTSFISYLRSKGVRIGENVNFRGPEYTVIDTTRPSLVSIGDSVDINHNFTILTHDYGTFTFYNLYEEFVASSGKVVIGNNIVFGRNVTILKGVEIGDNCVIGAGSIITKSIPSNSVAAGIPCRVICTLEDYYKKRKKESIEEAINYGCELKKKHGSLKPSMFTEEWTLFYRHSDIGKDESLDRLIRFRLKKHTLTDYFKNRKPYFDGFSAFEKEIDNRLNS